MSILSSGLINKILEQYTLSWHGIHGVAHWARVLENGRRLTALTGADREIVELFAIFHDSRRMNEGSDRGHGLRGAELAAWLNGSAFHLESDRFELLFHACADHTNGHTEGDITLQTCWDSDRLDLGRAGITPRCERLCTPQACDFEVLNWADRRSVSGYIPELVLTEWGIDLGSV